MKFDKALENLERPREIKTLSEIFAISEFAATSTHDVLGLPIEDKHRKIVRRKIRVPIINIGSITL